MSLALSLTIPANTPVTAPVSTNLAFNSMLVKTAHLTFPSGCAGLVGGRVYYLAAQLWPWNHPQWYVADGRTIDWNPAIWLDQAPFTLTLVGYNTDELYQHTLYMELDVDFQFDTLNDNVRKSALLLSGLGRPG